MKQFLTLLFALATLCAWAIPPKNSRYIIVDQFGYKPDMRKVAVLANPQAGFNAADSYEPGTTFEIRVWETDEVVFTGSPTLWNGGAIDETSGDQGAWFDFSEVNQAGSYYVYDVDNGLASYQFDIREDVYNDVLKAAVRMYYYNRSGLAKEAIYAGDKWTDGISFQQEANTIVYHDRSQTRDLRGGWFDAGDYNKYITFAHQVIHELLDAYEQNPEVFGDDFDIPESGNGLPDIIDELKWELDWMQKMQEEDGGVRIKMGAITHQNSSPPSTNLSDRYVGPVCSSSSITAASMFAHAAIVFQNFPPLAAYADELERRAVLAWEWYQNNPKSDQCDLGEIKAGDADISIEEQTWVAVGAAMYLWELTGTENYKAYFDSNYSEVEHMKNNFWGPYRTYVTDAMLRYTTLPGADAAVSTAIKNAFQGSLNNYAFYKFRENDDLYGAFMEDYMYHWGSNKPASHLGVINMNAILYGMDQANHTAYQDKAAGMLHYINGVNPMGMTYLTNMYGFGAEACVNEMYHYWFNDGTEWDHALNSPKGPAPGYLTGGPNASYGGDQPNIAGQPRQKAYRDWNTGFPENSWEISEPSITYQSSFVKLAAHFAVASNSPVCKAPNLGPDRNLCGKGRLWVTTNLSPKNRVFTWTLNGEPLDTQKHGIVVTQPGTYVVEVDSMGCIRRDQINILGDLTPDLGADFALCNPAAATLDAAISGNGYQYQWKKDGQLIKPNKQTLVVDEPGVYAVTVSAKSCDSKSDEITISSNLLPIKHAKVCKGDQAVITVETAGEFNWYATPDATEAIHVGGTYTIEKAYKSATYYVDNTAGIIGSVGRTTPGDNVWSSFDDSYNQKYRFSVKQQATLVSVDVYVEQPGTVKLNLFNAADGQTVFSTSVDMVNTGKQVLPVNFTMQPGNYLMNAEGSNAVMTMDNETGDYVAYPYEYTDVITIEGIEPEWANKRYLHFYNWQVNSAYTCGRTPAKLTVLPRGSEGCQTSRMKSTVENAIDNTVYPNPTNDIVTLSKATAYELYDIWGKLLAKGNGNTINLQTMPSGAYIIKTADKALRVIKE